MFSVSGKERAGYGAATVLLAAAMMLAPAGSRADSGLYVGGSVGQSAIEVDVSDQVQTFVFDEEDFAWKAFGGITFDVPVVNLGLEAGYVDFGAPSGDIAGSQFEVDADGFDIFGVLGFDLGPLGVFAKYGMISWDASISVDGIDSGSDDGSDPAYGVGAEFGLGSLDLRAEYEVFDIDDSDDVSMLSVGIVWTF